MTDPNGYTLKLDANRQGIADTFVQQLYDNNGTLGIKTIYKVVGVPQTLRRRLLADEAAPGRDGPGVRQGQRALEGHEGLVSA